VPPNTALEPMPLRGNKIVAILKAGNGPSAFLIHQAARLSAKPLGRHP
jgi:hypothetical protein